MKHSSEPAIREVLRESIEVKRQTMDWQVASAGRVAEALIDCFRAGGKLLLFGNGGSAADAQHVAAEFVGRLFTDHAYTPLP